MNRSARSAASLTPVRTERTGPLTRKNPLAELPLFQGVSAAVLNSLYHAGSQKHFARGEQIIRARVPAETVCILLSGTAFIYSLTHTGHRKIYFVCGPGTLLNDNTVGKPVSGSFCEALEDCQVFAIPIDDFLRGMKKDFALTAALIRVQERKLWRLEHQQKNAVYGLSLERKLAAKLWKLGRDFGIAAPEGTLIDLNLPVAFLADMMGVTRETTSRLRSSLIRSGLVAMQGKKILIPDPGRLKQFYLDRNPDLPRDPRPEDA